MERQANNKLPLFYGIKLRHAVALLACLGVILLFAGYFSIMVGQKATFNTVTAQGRALTEALLSSAEIIIEADDEFTEIGINNILEKIPASGAKNMKSKTALDAILLSTDADRISYIEKRKIISGSSKMNARIKNSDIENWLESIEIDSEAQIIYEFRQISGDRFLWAYFPKSDNTGLFLAKQWLLGQYGNQKLSLYQLLNKVARESGVEYIMLQNEDGIIFASKKIASMPRISDDPFLQQSLGSDTTRSRLITFQDREVLETVRKFKSRDFEGLFRVGLSMYGYRQLTSGMRRQVWLVVAALIILGMIGFGVVVGFQNYDLLKAGLHKASAISQGLLDSIPGPVVAVDSDIIITDINSAAENCFGISAGFAGGKSYDEIFPDDPFKFHQVLSGRRNASFEISMGRESGRFFVTATPLLGIDGRAIGAIAVAQDITAARKLEEVAESRRRLSEMGALAASMAHEIRNPLNAIGITIQRMKSEIKPAEKEEDYRKFIDGLRSEITRLNEIIEKFLAVARSTRSEIRPVSCDDLIKKVLDLFVNQAESKNIEIKYNPGSGILFEGDEDGMFQALVNVVKNSIEALGENGEITISVREADDNVVITVKDNGPGIDDTAAALKPFHTTKEGGTGLGLATASKILADHGGELIVESSPGKGCGVEFVIPRKNGGK